jgi:hypothetical protein
MLKAGDRVTCNFTEDSLYYPWRGQRAVVKFDDNRGVSIKLICMDAETALYVPYPNALDLDVMLPKNRSIYGRRKLQFAHG